MNLTPEIVKLMKPADRAKYAPAYMLPVVPDDGKQCDEEKVLQRLCEQDLGMRGIYWVHIPWRARHSKGHPDLTFCIPPKCLPGQKFEPGRPWAVELKSATGKVSADQQKTLALMGQNGWNVAVVRSFAEWRRVVFGEVTE